MEESEKKRKVVIHFVHTLYGGVAVVAANLINYQYDLGYEHVVAYVEDHPAMQAMVKCPLKKIRVTMPRFPGSFMLFGMGIKRVYEQCRKEYSDAEVVVHAHNVQTVGLFCGIKDIPMVCTLHSMRGNDEGIRPRISDFLYLQILKRLIEYKKPIVSVSNAIIQFYSGKIAKDCFSVIYNGVDESEGVYKREKRDRFTVGHIGNISKAKGWDTAFEGIVRLPKELRENIRFLCAGNLADIPMEQIQEMCKKNDMENTFCYLGFVPNAAEVVFPEIDLLVLASRNEGFGLVQIEAMSRGIPVLATDVGGICEALDDSYNGYVIRDAQSIAARISELIQNRTEYDRLSKNARKTYLERFTVEKMGNAYEEQYNAAKNSCV